jgi:hypothetical protein
MRHKDVSTMCYNEDDTQWLHLFNQLVIPNLFVSLDTEKRRRLCLGQETFLSDKSKPVQDEGGKAPEKLWCGNSITRGILYGDRGVKMTEAAAKVAILRRVHTMPSDKPILWLFICCRRCSHCGVMFTHDRCAILKDFHQPSRSDHVPGL